MSRDVVSAKLDIIFKKLFSENEDLLHDFLASILDIPSESIKCIQIVNPELSPETTESKFSRLDLNMTVDDKLVNVEIQIYNDPDYRDRALYYWAKLYTSELKRGEGYRALKQAITVNIINFNMFEGNDYHTEIAAVIKDTGEIFSDKFKMHFFELKKIGKKPNGENRRELWLQFINADSEEEFDMLSRTNVPAIQKAVKVIYDMSEDAKIRENARIREKALHDEASLLQGAENRGRADERSKIIENMKAAGFSESDIRKALGS